jgi:salicylate hydroxylase
MEKLAARIGDKARKGTMFLGRDKHILVFPIERGTIANIVVFSSDRSKASANATWNDSAWIIPSTKEAMMSGWEGWSDDCKAILESLSSTDKWALHELHDFPTHTVGPVCILGDAAAGTLPHQGQGAAQAIESACTLANLFTCPGLDRSNSQAILQVFDEIRYLLMLLRDSSIVTGLTHASFIRRERVTKVKNTSFELGKILEFADDDIKDDSKLLQDNLSMRYNWIWSWNGEAEIAQGLRRLQDVLKSQAFM